MHLLIGVLSMDEIARRNKYSQILVVVIHSTVTEFLGYTAMLLVSENDRFSNC